MSIEGELRHEDLLWLLGSLCGLSRIPFDAALIAQDFPPPTTRATLHQAARALGFKTGARRLADLDWSRAPFPVIAFLHADLAPAAPAPPDKDAPATPLLLLKTDGHSLLAFRPGASAPETLPL